MGHKFTSVDEYIESFTGDVKDRLIEIRHIIQSVLPKADEGISYNIPAYKQDGQWVAYFSGYAKHVSLALGGPIGHIVEKFAKELAPYKTSTAAIQFQNHEPLPGGLIKKLIKFRLTQ
jgi:uncharacterized protein YdhG (YjbR/CyaY superfamily)